MPVALKTLALDTSSDRASIALLEGDALRAELRFRSTSHATTLLEAVEFLLKKSGWNLEELGLIASGTGPGSFTGIRIGVATAAGIAQSLAIPFAGVMVLDALAHSFRHLDGRIGALWDARRSEVYYAEYESRLGRIHRVAKPALMPISDLERRLSDRHLYIVGDVGVWKKPSPRWPRAIASDLFLAAAIGRLAAGRRRTWRRGDYVVADPAYIRPPDAVAHKRKSRRKK